MPVSPSRRRFCTTSLAGAALAAIPVGPTIAGHAGQRTKQVGDLRLTAISDGHFDLPLAWFAGPTTLAGRSADDPVRVGATAWIIETATRTIMVDTGSGDALRTAYPETGRLGGRLTVGGIDPLDITDIILTHLHADHIGGLFDRGALRFPNAQLHVAETEWRHWRGPDLPEGLPAAQRPIARLIAQLIAALPRDAVSLHPGMADLGEGVWIAAAPGHTPGHSVVRLASGSDQAVLLADTFICGPMQMTHPHVTYALDTDPGLAVETRRRLLDMLATDGVPFGATHLNTLALGLARREGVAYAFSPA